MKHAFKTLMKSHGRSYHHAYKTKLQLLDVDMTGLPCGRLAEKASKGYFANKPGRYGRQIMIKQVFLFRSGLVAVCDERGRQMPEFQGHYADIVERLRGQDLSAAEIHVTESIFPGGSTGGVTPEEFLSLEVQKES